MKFLKSAMTTAALCLWACPSLADPLTGNLTEARMRIITEMTYARFAGEFGKCPRYRTIQAAVFAELKEAGITPDMLDSQYFKNAQSLALVDAMVKYRENPSDFCLAAWVSYGPDGTYKRQMLEKAN
jgi:hypothetical protein